MSDAETDAEAGCLVGHIVRVDGLKSRPEVNSQLGVAEIFVEDTGRYVVKLPGQVLFSF